MRETISEKHDQIYIMWHVFYQEKTPSFGNEKIFFIILSASHQRFLIFWLKGPCLSCYEVSRYSSLDLENDASRPGQGSGQI